MKNLIYVFLAIAILSCGDKEDDCTSTPEFSEIELSNATDTSVSVSASITPPTCDESITSQGFVYSKDAFPEIDTDYVKQVSGQNVSAVIDGLEQNQKYYVRTYFENPLGVFYGEGVSFESLIGNVIFGDVSHNVTSFSEVEVTGDILSNGGADFSEVGVCFSKDSQTPSLDDNKVSTSQISSKVELTLEGLEQNTEYYYSIYTINEAGVSYTSPNSFETLCEFDFDGDGICDEDDYESIRIEAVEELFIEENNQIELKVFTNDNQDVTSVSKIYYGDTLLDGNVFNITSGCGDYEFYAKMSTYTSENAVVKVEDYSKCFDYGLSKTEFYTGENILDFISVYDCKGEISIERENTPLVDLIVDNNSYSYYNEKISLNTEGVFTFQVFYEGGCNSYYSDVIEIKFSKIPEPTYSKNIIVENYKGAWCGYCPRVDYKLEKANELNSKIIPISIHNGDAMKFDKESEMREAFGVNGFPTAKIDRKSTWNEPNNWEGPFTNLDELTTELSTIGIRASYKLQANSINVQVGLEGYTLNSKIIIYLLEDGFIVPQANYFNGNSSTPFYNMGNPIPDYVHDNVLIESITDVFGDNFTLGSNNEYSFDKTIPIPANVNNVENTKLVAFVVDFDGQVVNAKVVNLGESKEVNQN